jgi:hypothetical protein
MKNKYKIQKKKTLANTITSILFKILILIVIIVLSYITYTKTDLANESMSFTSKNKTPDNVYIPSKLRWFDSFQGIENVPSKNKKKRSGNFLNY